MVGPTLQPNKYVAPNHLPLNSDIALRQRSAGILVRIEQKKATPEMLHPKNYVKSKKRVVDHGEVFTPEWMVEAMLDLVKDEADRIGSRFLAPACGSGNFMVRILRRKLAAVELKYGKSTFERQPSQCQAAVLHESFFDSPSFGRRTLANFRRED